VKYRFIQDHVNQFPVKKMCQVMQVGRSNFYRWLKRVPGTREQRKVQLKEKIRHVYHQSKGRYGSPRIAKEINMQGVAASRVLVARLMKEENIRSIVKKKFKVTTDSSHRFEVVRNKLARSFAPLNANAVWVSDITYIGTREGWLYLTTVIDLFDRKAIGWALSTTMKATDTVIPAFRMATANRYLDKSQPLLFHSDRGTQYACGEFVAELQKYPHITRSMSGKGDCWDNAVAESFFKTLKAELVNHEKYATRQQAMLSIFEYIETFYNTIRRHSHLGNLNMNEFYKLNNQLKNAA
jgi:putative transposase